MTRIHLRLIGWIAVLFGSWALFLLLLQGLFGRQVDRLQVVRLGRELALQVRLTELTLERYPPTLIQELTGLDLVVIERPASRSNPSLVQQERLLEQLVQPVEAVQLSACNSYLGVFGSIPSSNRY